MKKVLFLIFILFFLSSPNQIDAQESEIDIWLNKIREDKFGFTDEEILLLKKDPKSLTNQKEILSTKYDTIKELIFKKKIELKKKYLNSNENDKTRVISEAKKYLKISLEKILIPIWIGGKWSYDGVPGKRPNLSKPVACSHFIQKILSDIGFNIKRNGSTWLAYLSSKDILVSIKQDNPDNYAPCEKFRENFPKGGERIYLIGLGTSYCGTILFGFETNREFYFVHAGISQFGIGIRYENPFSYVCDFIDWSDIYLIEFDEKITLMWLLDTPIIPVVNSN